MTVVRPKSNIWLQVVVGCLRSGSTDQTGHHGPKHSFGSTSEGGVATIGLLQTLNLTPLHCPRAIAMNRSNNGSLTNSQPYDHYLGPGAVILDNRERTMW